MAKRFTDTEKWKKKWIRKLDHKYKLFWVFICDDCNHAGIWDVDLDVANIRLGLNLTEAEILTAFKEKLIPIDNGDKWFIPKFVDFQYGELNSENRVHSSVLSILKKEGAYKGLKQPLQGCKDKAKDKDKDKDKDNIKDKHLDFVYLTKNEVDSLKTTIGTNGFSEYVERLNGYLGAKGKAYKSHYHAIMNWWRKDGKVISKKDQVDREQSEYDKKYK